MYLCVRTQRPTPNMEPSFNKQNKFETLCGRTFESSAALASFLGVTKGAISHAKIEAREKGRNFFECGKPVKRYIRILPTAEDTSHESKAAKQESNVLPDNGRLLQSGMVSFMEMKCLQVQGHMQAAAMKLFPTKNLRMPINTDTYISVAVITTEDSAFTLFDVAEMWKFYYPDAGISVNPPSLEAFRRALLGDGLYGLAQEINVEKYPSLMLAASHWPGSYRPFMLPVDIVGFLLSPFARKSPYNALFDNDTDDMMQTDDMQANDKGKAALATEQQTEQATDENAMHDAKEVLHRQHIKQEPVDLSLDPPSYEECMSWPCTAASAMCAEDAYMQTCKTVMHDVSIALGKRRVLEKCSAESIQKQKRQVAAAAVHNTTTILLAANNMLYWEARKPALAQALKL